MYNVEAFESAGKEMFGEYGCLPTIALGSNKISSAFKMLARARELDPQIANEISKQIQSFELDKKHLIENNSDDPMYDVNDDINIASYVDEKYLGLIEESKSYQGIVVNISPHPCAHITYHTDLRKDIGIVRLKPRPGTTTPTYCLFIDGVTADKLNYVKSDLLKVDVVKIIAETFKTIGSEILPVEDLLEKIKDDDSVWDLYANGVTIGLNQCEKPASTQKCMQFKPKNIVELASFIASIRPGFKSMGQTFWSRTPFKYGIKSLDELLKIDGMTGTSADSAFLLYDEQILKLLKAGGIPGPEAYATIKHIKKKHVAQVLAEKEKFKDGFSKYLKETENASEELAQDVVEKIWKIIEDSSSYLFCCAHSFAMACDSAYCAYLKAHYPYEFYLTMLKIYTEKGNKEKISLIIDEMKKFFGISLVPGRFGFDNTEWTVDKDHRQIQQSLNSIKFMSKNASIDLMDISLCESFATEMDKESIISYNKISEEKWNAKRIKGLSKKKCPIDIGPYVPIEVIDDNSFICLLRKLQMDSCLNTRQIEILISLGYFDKFGDQTILLETANEFENAISKTLSIQSVNKRMIELQNSFEEKQKKPRRNYIYDRIISESINLGLCLSKDENVDKNLYYVENVDDKYGIKVTLYRVNNGKRGIMKVKKQLFEACPLRKGDFIKILDYSRRPRRTFVNGKSVVVNNEIELWLQCYDIINKTAEEED